MKIIEIHTPDEVSAEVVVLRADTAVMRLMQIYVLRPWCFEEDLRTEAYNRLSAKKFGGER